MICRSRTAFIKLTFNNGCHVIRPLSVAGYVPSDLDSTLELSPEKVAFVEEKDQLCFRQEL